MAKKLRISFILDETGSMITCKDQTISGFNEYMNTLKREKKSKNVRFTLVKFNSSKIDIVYDGVKISEVSELSDENYVPDNLTPLYDAIGMTITKLEKSIGKDKALLVIQTDGHENASREYTQKAIFDLVTKKRDGGWAFVFLGADQDAWDAGGRIGVDRGSTMSYNSAETRGAFVTAAAAPMVYMASDGKQITNLLNSDDEEDEK